MGTRRDVRMEVDPAPRRDALRVPPRLSLPPCTPAELRALVRGGENDSDACERLLAQAARAQGAVELALGDGLAALTLGDRLAALGFSSLRDYAREVLGIQERKAQAMARLSRELERRPLLRAATARGEVRIRAAETVLPVAVGATEAPWVERARRETVRALEAAVRAERPGDGEEQDPEWVRFQARLSGADRATVDEALELAGRLLPGSSRAERLEAMAQEYVGEHPLEAGDDGAKGAGGAFSPEGARRAHAAAQEERAERESEAWSYLDAPRDVPAPARAFDDLSTAEEIDAALRELAARRSGWDDLVGALAYVGKATGLWRTAGFASFAQYCRERLGLAPRTVEQRAALERRLQAMPALRAARDGGLSYEKVRLLSRLRDREVVAWVPRARALAVVELRAALAEEEETQTRAVRVLRARVPARVAELLRAAFRAVRAVEGCLLDDGRCLVRVARHFAETWRAHARKPRTASQKVRERDGCRCQVPGCSRRAAHSHHIVPRARGGSDARENLVALCVFHHLVGVHGGYLRVSGPAPDGLTWEIGRRHAPVDFRRWLGLDPAARVSARAA